MKEDRYLCLGLNFEQKKFIQDNIDGSYFSRILSTEQMYYTMSLNAKLFKDCVISSENNKIIVQKVFGR